MPRLYFLAVVLLTAGLTHADSGKGPKARPSPKAALQAFHDLIGSWRGTGLPEGSRQDRQRGFWTETIAWEWQFKGNDVWLRAVFTNGKHFRQAELRYLPERDQFQLTVQTPANQALVFVGRLDDRRLTLERTDERTQETQRLVLTLLHHNRYLVRYEVQPQGKGQFVRLYQVGATKEGVPFASGDGKPECVVSGGLGTMPVTHQGKTYYVCCSGCRDAFKDDPEKYIKEFEERKASEAKKAP